MGRDWAYPQEEWLDFDDGYITPGEEWLDYGGSAVFDQDWDAYEQEYAEFDEDDPQPDAEWFDAYQDWDEADQRVFAPVYGFRLGLGFVMTCALLIGAVLSMLLYKATSASISLLSDTPQNVQTPAEIGSDYEQEQVPGEIQTQNQEQVPGEQQATDQAQVTNGICAVSALFPPAILQWCDLITHYADKHGLPPDLIAALIWQESGGNPTAYSRSGAVGLMQVMPRDGLAASFMCKNGPCFSARPTIAELKDPEFNVAYGTKMLAGLLRRSGSLREALRSYGPMDMGYYYADKVLGIFQRYGDH